MGKILIVDDKDNIRQSLSREFSMLGQVVSEAKSADEAIDKISNEGYDCVVIDLKLDFKSRFGGLKVLDELSAMTSCAQRAPVGDVKRQVKQLEYIFILPLDRSVIFG